MRDALEYRVAAELRVVAGRKLGGYAAVFSTPTKIGGFTETIIPGAFRATLATRSDVVALVDHNPAQLLGRTASGTLRLSEDARGLAFELDVPATQLGNDMLALAQRSDLGGMSFGFHVPPGGDAWPARDVRELRAVDLIEVSIAQAWPAYPDTTIALRAREQSAKDAESASFALQSLSPDARSRFLAML